MSGKIVDGGETAQIARTPRPMSRSCCGDVAYEVGKNTAAATNVFDRETPKAMNYFNNKAKKVEAPAPVTSQVTADDIEANKGEFCGVGEAEYNIGRNTADATNVFEKHGATAAQKHFQKNAPAAPAPFSGLGTRVRRFLTKI
mmetsp:Transcript_26912/g.60447  ORF Transcript_26912/g.60447 Transcript_26912/m.60447 type:complete len:143 (-) Transcript_26912:160-588(-)